MDSDADAIAYGGTPEEADSDAGTPEEEEEDSDADTIPYGDTSEEDEEADIFSRDSPESPECPDAKRPRLA